MKGGETVTDFEHLYRAYREPVFRYLQSLSRSGELAEELTQETFYRAYMNYASLRNKENAAPWLFRIARNAYYSFCKEQKHSLPLEAAESFPAPDDVAATCENRALSEDALRCLHELDEPYKEVFMLAVFGGMPMKEISALFGKSESWARVTFYRAKQKLQESMRERYGS